MSKYTIRDFQGVIPAVMTIFDQQEELDEKATREFIRYLLGFKIGGLYLTGSTGEGFLMTPEERKRCVDIVMDEVKDQIPVVVHVGAISTRISIDLAKHAEKAGAVGISSVPPFYWRFSENQIIDYYRDIADSTSLPMIVYNIPLAGLMSIQTIIKLSKLNNVAGVKYTASTLYEVTQIKDACGSDFLVYGGADELASSNIALNCDGIIGSFYNMIPDLFIDIMTSVKASDLTKAAQLQANAVRIIMNILNHGSMMAAMKACLRHAGVNAGYARRPFNNFTPAQEKEIVKSLLEVKHQYNIQNVDILNRLDQ